MRNNTPPSKQSTSSFEIVMFLTQQFVGLNPFEIKKRDFQEVLELYVQTIISLNKKQNESKKPKGEWVTSKNASWH